MNKGASSPEGNNAPATRPRSRPKPDHLQVKTYVILRRVFKADPKKPNVEVLDVKLNLGAAEAIRDTHAGTWIERVMADKLPIVTRNT